MGEDTNRKYLKLRKIGKIKKNRILEKNPKVGKISIAKIEKFLKIKTFFNI